MGTGGSPSETFWPFRTVRWVRRGNSALSSSLKVGFFSFGFDFTYINWKPLTSRMWKEARLLKTSSETAGQACAPRQCHSFINLVILQGGILWLRGTMGKGV